MNTAGWFLTESGRQPWIVQGIQLTRNAVSPSVSAAMIATSLIVFLLLYLALGIVDVVLMLRYARISVPEPPVTAIHDQAGGPQSPVPAPTY